MHITSGRDKLVQAKRKEAPVRAHFHSVSRQQKIPQRGQDLLLLEPSLFGQRFAGLLHGVRLATHPFAIG